ncbi:MAG TPA: tyrosine-type recombinase/integrase [Jatrophihabitans sp.]|nr:tyrosine-type recombinase/integrase [Jatrophihabitans sp.]
MSKAVSGRSSIHRRKDGAGWEGWVSFGIDPRTGKRRRSHVRGRTKSEVDDKIKALETARSHGTVITGADTTLSDYLDTWVGARSLVVRPNTLSGYRTDLLHVRRSGVGAVKLRALTAEHIERLYAAVLATGCSPGSVVHVRRTLSAALNAAARRGHILRNPVPLADLPRRDEEPELEPYDAAEIAALLTSARNRRNGVRWSLAFLGLRQGEALALRWDDVNLADRELRVRHTLTWLPWRHGCVRDDAEPVCGKRASACPRRHGGGAHLGPPKSRAGRRTIALPEPVVAELHEHHRRQAAERLAAGPLWTDRDFVLTNRTGGPVDRSTDTEDWLDLVAHAGVRRLRLHDCRHSAATALLVLGTDARVLMATMGWTSMSLVQRYTHMVPELRHDVAARQAALWPEPDRERRTLSQS